MTIQESSEKLGLKTVYIHALIRAKELRLVVSVTGEIGVCPKSLQSWKESHLALIKSIKKRDYHATCPMYLYLKSIGKICNNLDDVEK